MGFKPYAGGYAYYAPGRDGDLIGWVFRRGKGWWWKRSNSDPLTFGGRTRNKATVAMFEARKARAVVSTHKEEGV